MKMFEANFGTIILRYYLLMAVIVAAFFSGYYFLALLAVPIFISALMGTKFTGNNKTTVRTDHSMNDAVDLVQAA